MTGDEGRGCYSSLDGALSLADSRQLAACSFYFLRFHFSYLVKRLAIKPFPISPFLIKYDTFLIILQELRSFLSQKEQKTVIYKVIFGGNSRNLFHFEKFGIFSIHVGKNFNVHTNTNL